MSTRTTYYNLTKPDGNEHVDRLVINQNYDAIDLQMHANFDAAQNASDNIIGEYDSTENYAINDFCIYQNKFYKCVSATTGDFDPTAWTQTTVNAEFEKKHTWELFETITADGVENRYDRDLPVNCAAVFIEVYGKTGSANDNVHVYAAFSNNVWRRVGVTTSGINTAGDRYSQFWYVSDGNYWQGQQANPAAANQGMALQVRQNGYRFTSDPIKKIRINTDTNPFPADSTITIYTRQ